MHGEEWASKSEGIITEHTYGKSWMGLMGSFNTKEYSIFSQKDNKLYICISEKQICK